MASDILHIKDSFYFEVPKALWRKNYTSPQEFYDAYGPWVIRNHEQYQDWEAEKIVNELKGLVKDPKKLDGLVDQWKHWQHANHARAGRPIDQFLDDEMANLQSRAGKWASGKEGLQDKVLAFFVVTYRFIRGLFECLYPIIHARHLPQGQPDASFACQYMGAFV